MKTNLWVIQYDKLKNNVFNGNVVAGVSVHFGIM